MFQETILRNIPFCDEFVIFTNEIYENIVRGQMASFRDVNFSIIIENSPVRTAPQIITYALMCNSETELFIVSTDHVIDGDYNACMIEVKSVVESDKIAAIAVKAEDRGEGYHYFKIIDNVVSFSSEYTQSSLFDCGIFASKAGVLLRYTEPSFVDKCKKCSFRAGVFIPDDDIGPTGLNQVINTSGLRVVIANFSWQRVTNITSYRLIPEDNENNNIILNDCSNVDVINKNSNQLIVVNKLENVVIADTNDAIYITIKGDEGVIKDIARHHNKKYDRYFTERPVSYYRWGVREILYTDEWCKVSKLTIHPNGRLSEDGNIQTNITYCVLEGIADIEYHGVMGRYGANETVCIQGGKYAIADKDRKPLYLIETENYNHSTDESISSGCLYKMAPSLHYALWGGTKISDLLGKSREDMPIIAESWELSAHPAGPSSVAEGKLKGIPFAHLLDLLPDSQIGWKVHAYQRFPLLIKFIDANKNLSVQVHPDDDYAFPNENDYGKNEMWYIMDATDDAFIYNGFKRDVSHEEVRKRISDNTIEEVLNKIPVKKGETYFISAGTVHAIGGGCLICEIQQSSNVTYRLYDYGRVDINGKQRELHLDKALDVLNFLQPKKGVAESYTTEKQSGYTKQIIGQCKYFLTEKYQVNGDLVLTPNIDSFRAIVIVEGCGQISDGVTDRKTCMGDTWFVGAQSTVYIKGNLSLLNITI